MIESAFHCELPVTEALARIADERRLPSYVLLEPTRRCNLSCSHCYRLEDRHRPELPTERILRLLEELHDAGAMMVNFSGGECLMHPDFVPILRHAASCKLMTRLSSNGTLFTAPLAEALAACHPFEVGLTIYGAAPATHEFVTRVSGSFQRTLEATRLLKRRGVRVRLNFIVMQHSFGEFHDVKRLAERMNVPCDADHMICATDDGGKEPLRHRVTDEQLHEITRYWLQREHAEGPLHDRMPASTDPDIRAAERCPGEQRSRRTPTRSGKHAPQPDGSHDFMCAAGHTAVAITAYGDVFPCVGMPISAGNVMRDSFRAVWENGPILNELRDAYSSKLTTCQTCEVALYCGRCPGMALLEGRDLYGPSPEACRQARIRFATLHSMNERPP